MFLFLRRPRARTSQIHQRSRKRMSVRIMRSRCTTHELQVLLRLIDDYLFITTDITKARHFLNVMNKGTWIGSYYFSCLINVCRPLGIWVFHLEGEDFDQLWSWFPDHECDESKPEVYVHWPIDRCWYWSPHSISLVWILYQHVRSVGNRRLWSIPRHLWELFSPPRIHLLIPLS